jgi:hypothetical protein
MLHTTNTIQLTEKQEDTNFIFVSKSFVNKIKDDNFSHFSFEGTRLNLNTLNLECVFEVHCDKGGFCVTVELNEKKQLLKRTLRIKEL